MNSEISHDQPETESSVEVEKPYKLFHSNVDGGGYIDSYEKFDDAKKEADRLQQESDAKGNYWYYRYHVIGPGTQEYHTRLSHIMVYVDGKFKLANVGCPNWLTCS